VVFFEGLELVTSFVFYKDGVIAAAAPDIWWIRDTDGDGKADKVQKLYTGLGTKDTHAVINNLRRGFDGWIYATHGYSSGTVTSPDGSKSFGTIGSGVVRFKPDGSAFEQYSSKGGNTWGLQITWDNEIFYTQPTSGDLLMNVVLPEERLAKGKVGSTTSYKVVRRSPKSYPPIPYDQLPYVQIDWVGSFTAAAGCVIYDGGSWPAAWNYSYFCTEPTINLIHHEIVTPDGVSYTADKAPERAEKEFIAGRDMWFRPIEVRTGPDGAMYVVDFYNQAVIHNDTRGPKHGPRNAAVRPDRDHYYGRIWQVNHKSAKATAAPDLSAASSEALVRALSHPNQQVRMTAQRLLVDGGKADGVPALVSLLKNGSAASYARVQAVWILQELGRLDESELVLASGSEDLALKKNAIQIAQLPPTSIRGPENALHKALMDRLLDSNPRVRLEAIRALGSFEVTPETAAMLARIFPTLKDPWLESALIGTAANAPISVIGAAMTVPDVEAMIPLVSQLTRKVAAEQDSMMAVELLTAITARRNASPRLQQVALTVLAQELKPLVIPAWDDSVQRALRSLLAVEDPTVPAATLTLVARWDTGRTLTAEVDSLTKKLITRLQDASTPEGQRGDLAISLLAIRRLNPQILPAITALLGGDQPPALQQRVLEAFGDLTDKQAGVELIAAFPKLKDSLQTIAFNQLLRRSSWSLALVDSLQQKKIDTTVLGPANLYRLRTHPDADVAKKANTVLDDLRGPEAKEKEALIAKLAPLVSQPGNVAKGKELFTANCAVCHMFGDAGRDVGPALTGMGAHGPAELLVHIIDPNRAMEFSYTAIDFEMADGESQSGVVVRENRDTVLLRNAGGEKELKKSEIKKRRNTGRSLMPEGFESLGAEGLRDILSYVCGENSRFRFIELASALTADTRKGIYNKVDSVEESLPFNKYGIVQVEGVPFNIVDPARNPGGVNVMVLKGGAGYAKNSLPQRVEAKVGFAAKQLHFLGNVAGWGFPINGGNLPVLKVIVQYVGGKTEELVFKNGDEFADYIREVDVPASKLAPGLVGKGRQLRFASRKLSGAGVIEKLVFESYDNGVAPTTVAVTADSSDVALPGATAAKAAPAPAPAAVVIPSVGPMKWEKGTKVLMVGGGSSHDFTRFFNFADLATLKAAGFSANYTENPEDTVRELKNVDVVLLSVNRKEWATPEVRKALFDFAAAGKGLVLLHSGIWYNFPDWPEYNLKMVGGGSRGHDKLGEFGVKVLKDHPITAGVTKEFKITDELYYMTPDPAGSAIDVLVETTNSIKFGKPHPSVYVVQHPKARIAAIALGHDARAHDLPEFKKLLINSINWSAGKTARTE
ncbi:MAG TPA: PVC-type heme-binding CxxCH protein, partial [Roseimicrobium sp.]|nr:PVC-type heme-binding CxxCH protein [Roseimicrobium sp.]